MTISRIITPIIIISAVFGTCYWMFKTEEEPRKWPKFKTIIEVSAETLKPMDYQVILNSQGTVQARTESNLIPEVRGRVISISPSLRAGGFFEKDEVLMTIDPRDYVMSVTVAEAALAQAELKLFEEEASSQQAIVDWKRLQPGVEPSELVKRGPQLKGAKANVASAKARLDNARLNQERTEVKAPYAGRVLSKSVDVGQYVSPGNVLAKLYAVDFAEIRLPLSERQLAFMNLPESYRGEEADLSSVPKVDLKWAIARDVHVWEGRVVRAEGSLDTRSRQLFVVAQVEDPYEKKQEGRPPLKVGTFVQATIQGKVLKDVFVIPRKLHRRNEYVIVVDKNEQVVRRDVQILWSDDANLIIDGGLEAGDQVCLTPLNFPTDGMQLAVTELDGEPRKSVHASKKPQWGGGPPRGGPPANGGAKSQGGKEDKKLTAMTEKMQAAFKKGDYKAGRELKAKIDEYKASKSKAGK